MKFPPNLQDIAEYRRGDSHSKVMTVDGSARSRQITKARECLCLIQLKQLPQLVIRSAVIINFRFEQTPVVALWRADDGLPRERNLAVICVFLG